MTLKEIRFFSLSQLESEFLRNRQPGLAAPSAFTVQALQHDVSALPGCLQA